jgi:DNA-binding NarL/FixJ family response regulator
MPSKEPRVNLQFITQREREILNLIAEGYKSTEIADDLNISVRTVEKYLYNLRRKTNLHNTSSLLDYAFEKKVIDIYEILESYFQKRTLKQMKDNRQLAKA